MKVAAAVTGAVVLLIAGWTQREFIGSELGLGSQFASDQTFEVDTSRIVTRRVWAGADADLTGSPSPDGKFVSHVDWTTGDLAIRNLATGESRRLTDKGPWAESSDFALFPVVSRDGRSIAYLWFNLGDLSWEIRVVGSDGSDERVVYDGSPMWVQPYDWSPDNRSVLMRTVDTTGVNRLGLVGIEGGTFRTLTTVTDGRSPLRAGFSPGGRYVLFDDHGDGEPPQSDIFVIAVDGGGRRPLVEHPANDVVLGWSPDGSSILFASDRTGTLAAWLLPVADGRAAGSPILVKSDLWRATGMGFTQAGSFFYGLELGSGDVYLASVDVASGRVLTPPTAASQRFMGSNSSPEWSPDGEYLAYRSRRGPSSVGPGSVIVIRSLSTGEERTIEPDLSAYQGGLRWSPDGRFLLTVGSDRRSRSGIFVVDVQTGATRRVVETPPGGGLMSPSWLRGATSFVYVERSWTRKQDRILVHDLSSDATTELRRWKMEERWLWVVQASPDGNSIAFFRTDAKTLTPGLYMMPAAGGPEREVVGLAAKSGVPWDLNWTPDGTHLVYVVRYPPGSTLARPREIWAVAVAGGEPYRIDIEDVQLGRLRIHPDGRRIAYQAGESQQEVWVMEDFLPERQTPRDQ